MNFYIALMFAWSSFYIHVQSQGMEDCFTQDTESTACQALLIVLLR